MSIEVRQASDVVKAQRFEVHDGVSAHAVKIAQVRDASGNAKTFWQEMSGVAAPPKVTAAANSGSTETITTNATTVTVTGGTAPYTYLWSGGGTDWSVDSPTSATTTFTRANLASGAVSHVTFVCTVTDAAGITAVSNNVTARAQNVIFT